MAHSDSLFEVSYRPIGAALALVALAVLNSPASAEGKVNTGYFGNVAIKGYDTVAYFTDGKATQGSEEYRVKWLGATWQFASAEHKDMFAANPTDYAPQYGGHCATGMALHGGLTKDIDPDAWAIIDGKLYLNYSKETQKLMAEGIATPEKADAKWQKYAATATE